MTPEQLKKVCVYLAFFLLVSLAFHWFQYEAGRNKDLSGEARENRYRDQLALKDAEIARRNAFISAQDSARQAEAQFHVKRQDSLQSVINRVYRRIIPTQTLAETAPDTCKHLIAQIEKRDSVISLTNAITEDLKKQVSEQVESYESSLDSLEANVQAEKEKFELADSERDSLKNLRKPSRWSLSLSAGPGGAYNPFNGRVHGGVIFGITTSYRINLKRNRK